MPKISFGRPRRRWRHYRAPLGRKPVRDYLDGLPDEDLAEVLAAMYIVRRDGLPAARHLRGEIYEVRATARDSIYRVLFAPVARHKQVFLTLEAFAKKTQQTPDERIRVAERRLRDWKKRSREVVVTFTIGLYLTG